MCELFESEQLVTNDSDFDHRALGKSNPMVCPLDHLQAITGASRVFRLEHSVERRDRQVKELRLTDSSRDFSLISFVISFSFIPLFDTL